VLPAPLTTFAPTYMALSESGSRTKCSAFSGRRFTVSVVGHVGDTRTLDARAEVQGRLMVHPIASALNSRKGEISAKTATCRLRDRTGRLLDRPVIDRRGTRSALREPVREAPRAPTARGRTDVGRHHGPIVG
jgi:hypothetical protein